jgi:hypothetical protein
MAAPMLVEPRDLIRVVRRRCRRRRLVGARVGRLATRCAYQILRPAILMMKSAKDWPRGKLAVPLDRPIARRILAQ